MGQDIRETGGVASCIRNRLCQLTSFQARILDRHWRCRHSPRSEEGARVWDQSRAYPSVADASLSHRVNRTLNGNIGKFPGWRFRFSLLVSVNLEDRRGLIFVLDKFRVGFEKRYHLEDVGQEVEKGGCERRRRKENGKGGGEG